jgi:hypothetical protein
MPAFTCLAAAFGASLSPLQPVFWKQETGILAQVERDEHMGWARESTRRAAHRIVFLPWIRILDNSWHTLKFPWLLS